MVAPSSANGATEPPHRAAACEQQAWHAPITVRNSSGSSRVARSRSPTKSHETTVRWRRSASTLGATVAAAPDGEAATRRAKWLLLHFPHLADKADSLAR